MTSWVTFQLVILLSETQSSGYLVSLGLVITAKLLKFNTSGDHNVV